MVKDSIMKIKKKSKLKAELQELSSKKAAESNSVGVNGNIPNGVSDEHKHRKKSKKHKKDINENEHPIKKPKIENIIEPEQTDNTPNDRHKSPLRQEEGSSVHSETKLKAASNGNSKDTLMARLRSASSDIKKFMSVLHIPNHKTSNGEDSDDGEGTYNIVNVWSYFSLTHPLMSKYIIIFCLLHCI